MIAPLAFIVTPCLAFTPFILLELVVILVVLPFTVVVNDVILLALDVILPSAVSSSVFRVVMSLELAVTLLFVVVIPEFNVAIFVALVAIRRSLVTVQTLGDPETNIYALLLSLVSNHIEPTGTVTAGASFCLNTSGLPATLVVLLLTVVVSDVTLLALLTIAASAVFKSFVRVVILLALVAMFVLAVVISASLLVMLVVLVATVAVKLVVLVAF